MKKIEIIKPGLLTTIQDKGRFGMRAFGVPLAGCMDQISAEKANLLLGNDPSAALLEMTITGPEIVFHGNANIIITGAEIETFLDKEEVRQETVISVYSRQTLRFGKLINGSRAYLGIQGGFDIPLVYKSASTHILTGMGGWHGRALKKGDIIPFKNVSSKTKMNARIKLKKSDYSNKTLIKVTKGPEFKKFDREKIHSFLSQDFTILHESNRMSYKVEAPKVLDHNKTLISSIVMPGTIQLPPNGEMIILMRDCQTTGGYPRILQVEESDISLLAQKKAGKIIRFDIID